MTFNALDLISFASLLKAMLKESIMASVKRLRCSPDSMLHIEQAAGLMRAIVNLSPLGVTCLGSI